MRHGADRRCSCAWSCTHTSAHLAGQGRIPKHTTCGSAEEVRVMRSDGRWVVCAIGWAKCELQPCLYLQDSGKHMQPNGSGLFAAGVHCLVASKAPIHAPGKVKGAARILLRYLACHTLPGVLRRYTSMIRSQGTVHSGISSWLRPFRPPLMSESYSVLSPSPCTGPGTPLSA